MRTTSPSVTVSISLSLATFPVPSVMTSIWSPECLWNLLREPAENLTIEKLKLLLSPRLQNRLAVDLVAGHQAAGHLRFNNWHLAHGYFSSRNPSFQDGFSGSVWAITVSQRRSL